MSEVSRTSPHCVHTASPLDGSTSIDVEPHEEHLVAPLDVDDEGSADPPPDAPVAAEGPELLVPAPEVPADDDDATVDAIVATAAASPSLTLTDPPSLNMEWKL